jgi:hypothetical protein
MNPLKINDTTYELTLPPGDRVEIGDKDSADFKPCARLNRWGTECSLVLTIPINEKILPAIQDEKILWQGRDYGAEFFVGTDGFKFNVILPEKPGTNVFPLEFGSDNLKFYYQPPLTEEFKEGWSEEFQTEIKVTETRVTDLDGNVLVNRPEKVVGSYAVYHAARGNIHAGNAEAEKYKTGKAFHWYRPLIYDNAGHTTWGILNVDPQAGLRTVTIPQEFLDKAVYPVVIDDDFGYTSQGGSTKTQSQGYQYGDGHTYSPASDGNADSVSAYLKQTSAFPYIRLGCFASNNSLAFESEEWQITSSYDGLKTFSVSGSPAVSSATSYYLGTAEDELFGLYYDSGGTGGYKYENIGWQQGYSFEDPWSGYSTSSNKYYLSIYCTYTPSGGGATGKTGSDAGTGADAKAEGSPLAAINGAETGSGADSLPARDIALPEAGSGVDALVSLQTPAAKTSSDAGSGAESAAIAAALVDDETGSGADAFVSLRVPQNKVSSDIGSGAEAVPVCSAVLAGNESGSGVEAFISRLLAAAEAGYGAEASEIGGGGLLKHLFASELGEGADGLTAKIEIPNKGGGMKLWT